MCQTGLFCGLGFFWLQTFNNKVIFGFVHGKDGESMTTNNCKVPQRPVGQQVLLLVHLQFREQYRPLETTDKLDVDGKPSWLLGAALRIVVRRGEVKLRRVGVGGFDYRNEPHESRLPAAAVIKEGQVTHLHGEHVHFCLVVPHPVPGGGLPWLTHELREAVTNVHPFDESRVGLGFDDPIICVDVSAVVEPELSL